MSYAWLESFFAANPDLFKCFYITSCLLLFSLVFLICITAVLYMNHMEVKKNKDKDEDKDEDKDNGSDEIKP